MPKEIEIKIQLTSTQIKQLKDWLDQNAQSQGTKKIIDHYLDNPKQSNYVINPQGYKDPLKFWRVRQVGDIYYLCQKIRSINKNGKTLNVEEYEAVTPDGNQAIQIFLDRGFTDHVIIKKTRDIYRYLDFEIVFDSIKKLGKFVEIELIPISDQRVKKY